MVNNPLILLARANSEVVGFKAGYALDDDTFYSWLGGVVPQFRRHGIARQLMLQQEQIIQQNGYQKIRVKSMNQYHAMLLMLLNNHYVICGYEDKGDPNSSKICFEKTINGNN